MIAAVVPHFAPPITSVDTEVPTSVPLASRVSDSTVTNHAPDRSLTLDTRPAVVSDSPAMTGRFQVNS